jgi:hypothetical protein
MISNEINYLMGKMHERSLKDSRRQLEIENKLLKAI